MAIYYGSSGDVRTGLSNPTESEISSSDIDLGRKKATAVVNSYLEVAYPSQVPWANASDVPTLINSITDDIAIYYIKRDKSPGPVPLSDGVKSEFWDKSIALLEKIQKGEIKLAELTANTLAEVRSNRSQYTPVFDMDDADDWVIDGDLLSDIADNK